MAGTSWLISIGIAIVAICAALAAFGFRGRVSTVGIDLGTTFSVVGVSIHGKVSIIPDKHGNVIFPSVVSYQGNGEILAGYDAIPMLTADPQRTIFNSKRFIGRSLTDPAVEEYASKHPFQVVPLPVGKSNYSEVGFAVNRGKGTIDGSSEIQYVSPEEVGTEVLKYLLKITSDFLGHKQVNKAVIAVPAKFDSNQRAATAEAYKKAGLKVVRVIEEPTAAAVAYNLHKKMNIHHILVYDFGGGTLDVSLLFVSKGSVQVYATDGDESLGGSDFDMRLYDYIKGKIEEISGQELQSSNDVLTATAKDNQSRVHLCVTASVRQQAEQIKKDLSSSSQISFSCIMPSNTILRQSSSSSSSPSLSSLGASTLVQFTVTLEDFHRICDHLFQRGLIPVHRLLNDLNMSKDDIDEVVLVGGTTRIPKIKQQLRELFGKELNDHIDPDITVAYGAASVVD